MLSGLGMMGVAGLAPLRSILAGPGDFIPQNPSARVIVDNDFAGDPDGLIALAHQLLSPKTLVRLVTVSATDPRLSGDRAGTTAAEGQQLAGEMMHIAGLEKLPPVIAGAEDFEHRRNGAVEAIVNEAMRDDQLPLFLTCGGPLTNVAAALRFEPGIAERMTVIWIGGVDYPRGGAEYNLATDLPAARFVLEESQVPLWQIPQATYRTLQFSVAEMSALFRPLSPLTKWLYERYTNLPDWVQLGGSLTMGDSPLVLLTAISEEGSRYQELAGRKVESDLSWGSEIPGRTIRVYEALNERLLLADMLAKFRLNA